MKTVLPIFAALLFAAVSQAADRHLLYMASPDGAQPGGSGEGVLIFDIDDGHKFVRRIDVPIFKEGIRGFCANAKTHRAYYSTTNHTLGCLDLETDKIVWEKKYPSGCDRAAVTPDEKELWISDQDGKRLYIFDATHMPPKETGHGWITFSLDGRFAWCHTPDVIDTKTRQIVATLKDGEGKPVCGSKFFEADFREGKVTAVGDQFGVGRAVIGK